MVNGPMMLPAEPSVVTVTIVVAEQPKLFVYAIIAVPVATPVTEPPEVMLAIPEALLLHVPPPVASVKVVVPPRHTSAGSGLIAKGFGLTLIIVVVKQVPTV